MVKRVTLNSQQKASAALPCLDTGKQVLLHMCFLIKPGVCSRVLVHVDVTQGTEALLPDDDGSGATHITI